LRSEAAFGRCWHDVLRRRSVDVHDRPDAHVASVFPKVWPKTPDDIVLAALEKLVSA
jgi:hypothetical protein